MTSTKKIFTTNRKGVGFLNQHKTLVNARVKKLFCVFFLICRLMVKEINYI